MTARSRRHDLPATRAWVRTGTDRLLSAVDALTDEQLREASLLPGWTRAHVVAHVARNAEALGRLVRWARTGEETPMYVDEAQRDREIETSSQQPEAALREDLRVTAADLEAAFDGLDERAWSAQVRNRQGQQMRASVLPWLRVREVWLHSVDLGVDLGAVPGLDGAPDDLVDELLDDVSGGVSRQEGCPSVLLTPSDRERTWSLGPDADGTSVLSVHGPAGALLVWLTGRSDGTGLHATTPDGDPTAVPTLPAWL